MLRKLVLANQKEFIGEAFGSTDEVVGELVFNTSMVGYQEVLANPVYQNQLVCMTYPIIGSYGLADDDYDAKRVGVKAMIVGEYNDNPSNFRATKSLNEAMEENNVVGISGIDTRELTQILRDEGTQKAIICDLDKSTDEALALLNNEEKINYIGSKKVWTSRTANPQYTVGVVDLGVKTSFVKMLNQCGLNVVVFPAKLSSIDLAKYHIDAIVISNGARSPLDNDLLEIVNSLQGKLPLLGIGLGMNLLGLTYQGQVTKLKTGYHGDNITVKNLNDGKLAIVSCHSMYALVKLDDKVKVTYRNLFDNHIFGIRDDVNKVIGYLCEASDDVMIKELIELI